MMETWWERIINSGLDLEVRMEFVEQMRGEQDKKKKNRAARQSKVTPPHLG